MEIKMFKVLVINHKRERSTSFQSITYIKTATIIKVDITIQHYFETKTIVDRKMETKTSIKITIKYKIKKYLNLNSTILV